MMARVMMRYEPEQVPNAKFRLESIVHDGAHDSHALPNRYQMRRFCLFKSIVNDGACDGGALKTRTRTKCEGFVLNQSSMMARVMVMRLKPEHVPNANVRFGGSLHGHKKRIRDRAQPCPSTLS
jgi:hypothetical protein